MGLSGMRAGLRAKAVCSALIIGAFVVGAVGTAPRHAQAADKAQELANLPDGALHKTADYVFVEKGKRQLTLWRDGWLLASFPIRLGRTPTGAKAKEGDGRTPEGVYTIDFRKPDSSYYRALHISYPSAEDIEAAQQRGVRPGGAIMIHGLPNETEKNVAQRIHKYVDWTEGCIALTNAEIDQIWQMVPVGTPIEIVP